jgi:predicted transcriptional regulator
MLMTVYNRSVTIDLPRVVEEQLRELAKRQNRDIADLIEDAVRQYLEAAAITDLDPNQVAETQAKLLGELPPISKWEVGS